MEVKEKKISKDYCKRMIYDLGIKMHFLKELREDRE